MMDKLKMQSPDLTQDNIAKIRAMFPGCVTEAAGYDGKIRLAVDFDQLRQELSDSIVEGPQERYHLNWPGKREALIVANAPIAKTLRPALDESVDFDTTQNLFIEGDNLEALKLLQETYLGKVKMIYIDPPYNTGNDFVYEDDFSQSSAEFFKRSNQTDDAGNRLVANTAANGRFHSDWLSMMYPRLRLARSLLSDDGAIFISIDDGEVHNLRKAADEVFGENNFIANIVWQKKYSPQNDAKYLSDMHDHVLLYARSKENWSPISLPRTAKQDAAYKNPDNDPRGPWKATDATCNKSRSERPNLFYPIKNGVGEDVLPLETRVWRYSRHVHEEKASENRVWWGKDGRNAVPAYKSFLTDVKAGRVPTTIWTYDEAGHNQSAKQELNSLIPESPFSTPKPTKLIRLAAAIAVTPMNNDIVLDFFAGSGTTADAIIKQNCEDGGNRRTISVQLPEETEATSQAALAGYSTIAEIAKERIRRAGVKALKGECHTDWNKDVGFRVLKIDSSNMADVFYAPDETTQAGLLDLVDNIKADRSPEDLLFQVLLDWGVDLTLPIRRETLHGKTVFFVADTALVACFDSGITDELVKDLAARQPLRIVFRDTAFKDDASKINAGQIFKSLSPATDIKAI
jgi:adenine-specific DNA-methyltransferase